MSARYPPLPRAATEPTPPQTFALEAWTPSDPPADPPARERFDEVVESATCEAQRQALAMLLRAIALCFLVSLAMR